MHHLFHNMLELLPCFVSSLVSVVLFYVGSTMINMICANHKNTIQGECVVFFFLEIWKLIIRWKDHWRIDDSPNCRNLLLGGVVLILFATYVCHLPTSNWNINCFLWISCWWGSRVHVFYDLCISFVCK